MSDNVLKKDFNKKDVERLRNLVKGKAGERTTQGIGYTKKEEFHKEGDILMAKLSYNKSQTKVKATKIANEDISMTITSGNISKFINLLS